MRVVIAGGSGFIGSHVASSLRQDGHEVIVISRQGLLNTCSWNNLPTSADAVINFAGEPIVGRWTQAKKRKILSSRVETTRRLVEWMASMPKPPSVFLSNSAVGYYGDRGDAILTERFSEAPAFRFRTQVCLDWEREARRVEQIEVRTVIMRIGAVLDFEQGFFASLFNKLRFAPFLSSIASDSYFPWIALPDLVRLVKEALVSESYSGPVNMVGPEPIQMRDVVRSIARKLGKPVLGSFRNWMLKVALGEFSQSILDSQRVVPQVAIQNGFEFEYRTFQNFMDGKGDGLTYP